jgi:uncharacterized membrane protein YeaQ/YmgE (transglycosylase-associated protein family)
MALLLSWISLGLFTGIGFHLWASDGMHATGRVLVAIVGAVVGGLALGFAASSFLPDHAFFTSLLPAVVGAIVALSVYRIVTASGSRGER